MPNDLDLYKKHRPKKLEDVIGQDAALASIRKAIARQKIPHCILFTGPTGVGKTTLGRIMRRILKCSKMDYHEKDCTTEGSPLDYVRSLVNSIHKCPMGGEVSIWFLEEFQSLARAGFSQQALLKLIEDCPDHVYFILATTDPEKINKALRGRATEIRLNAISEQHLKELVVKVANTEKMTITQKVIGSIAEAAEGSARKALVILEAVGSLSGEKAQLEAIDKASATKDEAIKLCRLLMFNRRPHWNEVAKILRDVASEDAEGIRRLMLSYARSCLIGGDNKPPNLGFAPKAYAIIDIFSKPFYDTQHAGLAAACWEFCNPS